MVLVFGSDEKAEGLVTLKDMEAGRRLSAEIEQRREWLHERPGQRQVPRAELVDRVGEMLRQIAGDEP